MKPIQMPVLYMVEVASFKVWNMSCARHLSRIVQMHAIKFPLKKRNPPTTTSRKERIQLSDNRRRRIAKLDYTKGSRSIVNNHLVMSLDVVLTTQSVQCYGRYEPTHLSQAKPSWLSWLLKRNACNHVINNIPMFSKSGEKLAFK